MSTTIDNLLAAVKEETDKREKKVEYVIRQLRNIMDTTDDDDLVCRLDGLCFELEN